jgi:hypothetical protein
MMNPSLLGLLNCTKLDAAAVLEMRTRFRDLTSFRGVVNTNEEEASEPIAAHDRHPPPNHALGSSLSFGAHELPALAARAPMPSIPR